MGVEPKRLHIVFFPFLAHGHMIPTLDIARLFAARNVEATIITTRVNAPRFTSAVDTDDRIKNNQAVKLELLRFPAQEAGVPEGCENAEIAMHIPGMMPRLFKGTQLLREQLEQYLSRVKPDCLVADMFYPWATESANKYDIPRIVFHGTSYFALCAQEITRVHEPYKMVSSNDEQFTIPFIPHDIKLLRSQMCPYLISNDEDNDFRKRMDSVKKSEVESYGVIVNSFYELEPDYAEVFKKELGRKAWHVGPVSLCNRSVLEKGRRGNQASIDEHECLTWLDSKKPASVVYISFGSMSSSISPQLHEIATALENSGCNFIWVVRNGESENHDECFPPGFEHRTKDKGLIIRGWAPQVLILEHEAVGAFVTHCGWNSTLEGITAGVPMITWPHAAEQFYNEKLVTEILKSGVSVGAKIWSRMPSVEDLISQETIETAIREVMDGEKAETMRLRAKQLKEMARKAVEEGGSSYNQLSALIEDLKNYHTQK